MSKPLHILGLMSGSSLDGVDMAVLRFSPEASNNEIPTFDWVSTAHIDYPQKWIDRLRSLPKLPINEWMPLDIEYCQFIADAVRDKTDSLEGIDALSWHGHTSAHHPKQGWTLAFGNGQTLATELNIPVITEFRRKDVALGGQGAPLAPIVDQHFFPEFDVALNLGGIANMTRFTDPKAAFDICGCNQLLNQLAHYLGASMDRDGKWAAEGTVNSGILRALNDWSYLKRPTPKSLGNHEVTQFYESRLFALSRKPQDLLATAVEHIADSIIHELKRNNGLQILLSGGGAHNQFLVKRLREKSPLQDWRIAPNPWVDYKEAFLMAYMAYRYMKNKNNVFSAWTGGSRDHRGGMLYNP